MATAPQLAPGSTALRHGQLRHGPVTREPAAAGSIVEVRYNGIILVRRTRGGPAVGRLGWRTDTGSRERAFTVYAQSGSRWLGVSVPALDGHLGWIAANPINLVARPAMREIHISLDQRRLELLDLGRVSLSTSVVIGSPESPTPTGQFSVGDVARYTPAN